MNKLLRNYIIVWAIMLLMFNVIIFAIPQTVGGVSVFGGSFWTGYALITLTLIGQLVCSLFALRSTDVNMLFFNMPLIHISYTALVIALIAGIACMVIPGFPNWAGIVVCTLVLGFYAIAIVKASSAADIVKDIDNKVRVKTAFIKLMTTDAETLLSKAASDEAKAAAKKVYEAIRFSDPMSNDALASAETQISLKFNEFSDAVMAGGDKVDALAEELLVLIEDRNRKCKILK